MQKKDGQVEFSKENVEEVFSLLTTDECRNSKGMNAKELTNVYNKFNNILEISEEDMQTALNAFSRELLDGKSENVESLDYDSFSKGLQNLDKTIKSSGKDPNIVHKEIMKTCAQLVDYNPQNLFELLDLPEELNRQDLLRLLNSLVRQ